MGCRVGLWEWILRIVVIVVTYRCRYKYAIDWFVVIIGFVVLVIQTRSYKFFNSLINDLFSRSNQYILPRNLQ